MSLWECLAMGSFHRISAGDEPECGAEIRLQVCCGSGELSVMNHPCSPAGSSLGAHSCRVESSRINSAGELASHKDNWMVWSSFMLCVLFPCFSSARHWKKEKNMRCVVKEWREIPLLTSLLFSLFSYFLKLNPALAQCCSVCAVNAPEIYPNLEEKLLNDCLETHNPTTVQTILQV